jgi:hypothetical protein
MPLGRFVYWIVVSGSGVNEIVVVGECHCAGSVVPKRSAAASAPF